MTKQCPFCHRYSLVYHWDMDLYVCHVYNATIPAEAMP